MTKEVQRERHSQRHTNNIMTRFAFSMIFEIVRQEKVYVPGDPSKIAKGTWQAHYFLILGRWDRMRGPHRLFFHHCAAVSRTSQNLQCFFQYVAVVLRSERVEALRWVRKKRNRMPTVASDMGYVSHLASHISHDVTMKSILAPDSVRVVGLRQEGFHSQRQ